MHNAFANAARLIAEPARAAMLIRLMGGRAVPAGELAMTAHVSPQTASEHLSKLSDAGFVTVRQQGRHRYYELANEEVAYVVESLLVLSAVSKDCRNTAPPALGSLQYARTCYAHLAGWVAVTIADALQREGYIVPSGNREFAVTELGEAWFAQHGIARRGVVRDCDGKLARQCLDWTERRPHLAGALGVAMYRRFVERGWIEATRGSRVVRITLEGRKAFSKHLHISVG